MSVLYFILTFCLYFVDVENSDCRCLQSFECIPLIGEKPICLFGCKSGWSGNYCDNQTDKHKALCHCFYESNCYNGICSRCQSGWTGLYCDRKITHIIYHNTNKNSEDNSSAVYNSIGYIALIIVGGTVFCCCVAAGIRRRNSGASSASSASRPSTSRPSTSRPSTYIIRNGPTSRNGSSRMWRTAASAESQMTNPSSNTLYEINRTNNGTSQPVTFELQTDIPSHMEQPPSYESIMSRSNEAFQSTDSLPPSYSALNRDSSEVIQTPPNYSSVTSQYNDNLQPSQSRELSNDISQTNNNNNEI